ncbi:MAG: hypothetical protein LBQ47_06985 [Endomicrobium sp.]|jgi:hypothetical protein|nr:hypothetical protein [Endomicrobium sp.]
MQYKIQNKKFAAIIVSLAVIAIILFLFSQLRYRGVYLDNLRESDEICNYLLFYRSKIQFINYDKEAAYTQFKLSAGVYDYRITLRASPNNSALIDVSKPGFGYLVRISKAKKIKKLEKVLNKISAKAQKHKY